MPVASFAFVQIDSPNDDATRQIVAGHIVNPVFGHHVFFIAIRVLAQAGVDEDSPRILVRPERNSVFFTPRMIASA